MNVRHLNDIFTRIIRAAQRRSEPVSMVYLDIDDFKKINDIFGHQHGDKILKTLAESIHSVSRKEDYCFRYGGDEFCIILPNCELAFAKNIYRKRLLSIINESSGEISISIGIVQTGPEQFLETADFIKKADEAMYAVKGKKKLISKTVVKKV